MEEDISFHPMRYTRIDNDVQLHSLISINIVDTSYFVTVTIRSVTNDPVRADAGSRYTFTRSSIPQVNVQREFQPDSSSCVFLSSLPPSLSLLSHSPSPSRSMSLLPTHGYARDRHQWARARAYTSTRFNFLFQSDVPRSNSILQWRYLGLEV